MARYAVLAMCLGVVIAAAAVLPADGARRGKPTSVEAVIAKGDVLGIIRADNLRRRKIRVVGSLVPQVGSNHPEVTLIVLFRSKPCDAAAVTEGVVASHSVSWDGGAVFTSARVAVQGKGNPFARTRSISLVQTAPGGEPQQILCTNETLKEIVIE